MHPRPWNRKGETCWCQSLSGSGGSLAHRSRDSEKWGVSPPCSSAGRHTVLVATVFLAVCSSPDKRLLKSCSLSVLAISSRPASQRITSHTPRKIRKCSLTLLGLFALWGLFVCLFVCLFFMYVGAWSCACMCAGTHVYECGCYRQPSMPFSGTLSTPSHTHTNFETGSLINLNLTN